MEHEIDEANLNQMNVVANVYFVMIMCIINFQNSMKLSEIWIKTFFWKTRDAIYTQLFEHTLS